MCPSYDTSDWRPRLTNKLVLEWADEYRRRTGAWPGQKSGRVREFPEWSWSAINQALMYGRFGHAGGTSLSKLLVRYRGHRNKQDLPRLRIAPILKWADDHYKRTGDWPKTDSGPVHAAPGETWAAIGQALSRGLRGLPGGSSLPAVLSRHRGYRDYNNQTPLRVSQILAWADTHHRRKGRWPTHASGRVFGAPGETWNRITAGLRQGYRGLPGGSSLAQLLAKRRGVRNHMALPPLTIQQILEWAEEHRRREGRWPSPTSGPIHAAPGETWKAIEHSLRLGVRSLPGSSSLARLLKKSGRRRAHG